MNILHFRSKLEGKFSRRYHVSAGDPTNPSLTMCGINGFLRGFHAIFGDNDRTDLEPCQSCAKAA